MSAHIILLPTAAAEPVRQPPRRGRYPAMVTKIRRGYQLQLEATLKAKKDRDAEWALGVAEGYRLGMLFLEQRRAEKNGGAE